MTFKLKCAGWEGISNSKTREREHLKQRNGKHAGLFPRLIDTGVTGLVSQERGAKL